MESIVDAFRKGGDFMYPILVVSIFVLGVTLERVVFLFVRATVDRKRLVDTVVKLLRAGDVERALKMLKGSKAPLARVLMAGVQNFNESPKLIQLLMDETSLHEVPKLENRIGFLGMLSNVATLTGLLGTVAGLIMSFGAVATADAATKATMLAAGISEAMNCTAFGLLVAIPALLMFAFLTAQQQKLSHDIELAATQVYNVIADMRRSGRASA